MMESLLPPNSTDFELKIEEVINDSFDYKVEIKKMWNVDECPTELLGWLAWQLSVDEWNPNWNENTKKQLIKNSITIHKKKGTVSALKNVLKSFGFNIDVNEWFNYDGLPHTFTLDIFGNELPSDTSISSSLISDIKSSVNSIKPLRSHYNIRLGDSFNIIVNCCVKIKKVVRMYNYQEVKNV